VWGWMLPRLGPWELQGEGNGAWYRVAGDGRVGGLCGGSWGRTFLVPGWSMTRWGHWIGLGPVGTWKRACNAGNGLLYSWPMSETQQTEKPDVTAVKILRHVYAGNDTMRGSDVLFNARIYLLDRARYERLRMGKASSVWGIYDPE